MAEEHKCAFYGEHEKDFEHLRSKYHALCKMLDDYREELKQELLRYRKENKQEWKDHYAYADMKVEEANAWKSSIKDILANFRLEMSDIKREFDGDINNMKLKHKTDIDQVKIDFLSKVNKVEKGQTQAVNKVLFIVIAGVIAQYFLPKIFG